MRFGCSHNNRPTLIRLPRLDNIIPVILFGNNWIRSNLIPTQIEASCKPNPPWQRCCTPERYYDKMTTRKSLSKQRQRKKNASGWANVLARSDVTPQKDNDGNVRQRWAVMNGGNKCEQERSLSFHWWIQEVICLGPAENTCPGMAMCSDNAESNSFLL